jgi:hypothetical protein
MKIQSRYKFLAVLAAVALMSFAILSSGPSVSAAGEGKITGGVKLTGTAPHLRGIDMSKDPYCSKLHESNPAKMENVVVGSGGGLAVNQKFKVTTQDQTTHNIHPLPSPGSGNIGWNKSQPPGAPPIETTWAHPEVAITVKCNIHPWMHGWHVVVQGPYAVTDDSGNYTINNVPPGNYTVSAWQEEYGTQTAKVTVAAGKLGTADFTFKAK